MDIKQKLKNIKMKEYLKIILLNKYEIFLFFFFAFRFIKNMYIYLKTTDSKNRSVNEIQ